MKLSYLLFQFTILSQSTSTIDAIPFQSSKSLNYAFKTQQQQQQHAVMNNIRGGEEASLLEEATSTSPTATTVNNNEEEDEDDDSLEDRVYAAMRKLGISVDENDENENGMDCKDGVCTLPSESSSTTVKTNTEDIETMTKRIAKDMNVDEAIVYAAIGATVTRNDNDDNDDNDDNVIFNEDAAREMIQNEVEAIQRVMEDCDEVCVNFVILYSICFFCFDFVH